MGSRNTKETGALGEALAGEFLLERGYQVVQRNWRAGRAEIDLIAREGELLVFIEVKTRSSLYFGQPEDGLSESQQNRLVQAAAAYMEICRHEGEIRFDVISIYWPLNAEPEIKHLKDAFFPGLA